MADVNTSILENRFSSAGSVLECIMPVLNNCSNSRFDNAGKKK